VPGHPPRYLAAPPGEAVKETASEGPRWAFDGVDGELWAGRSLQRKKEGIRPENAGG